MVSPQSNKWITFFEDNLLEDEAQPSNVFFWCQTALNEQADCSVDNDCSRRDTEGLEKTCPRKRSRDDSFSGPGTKACREKMRRDRLNDRFMDLSALLEPGKPPKQDKVTILSDTLRTLNQLRAEVQQLKDSNHQLRESIVELKAEKNELREEKQRLKTEREKLEQQIKLIMIPSGYIPHPSAIHATMTAFASQTQATSTKATSLPRYPGMPMWQWMPPAALDTSKDHVLRPPVA
eukprot:c24279_g1_i1 orf=551-1255(-)